MSIPSFSQDIDWKNGLDTLIKLDLNDEKELENFKISLSKLGNVSVKKLIFDMSKPSLAQVKKDLKETQIGATLEINLKNYYLGLLKNGKFVDELMKLEKQESLVIDIIGETAPDAEESMKFTIEITPKNASTSAKKNEFQFIPPPIPNFSSSQFDLEQNKNNRILLIDGIGNIRSNRGFQLFSFKEKNQMDEEKDPDKETKSDKENLFVKKNSLPVNKSLSVFAKNINFDGIQVVKVSLNGEEYAYNAGVAEIFSEQEKLSSEKIPKAEGIKESTTPEKDVKLKLRIIKDYLKTTEGQLQTIKFLNYWDLDRLHAYKISLKKSIEDSKTVLDSDGFEYYFKIMSFNPAYVNLTPYALTIPNADEVTVETLLKFSKDGIEQKYTTGVFRTSHSMTFRIGSSLFFTGLKNNNVYTETVTMGDNEELRAKMDEDDQLSVGIGVNSEVSWRIGSMFRPNFNVAFFVPFAEEITPFVGVGPGISFYDKNVSLNLSGGLAFGLVNSISEQYRDRNLNGISDLTNTSLVQKVWENDWYFSIGIGFNINSDK